MIGVVMNFGFAPEYVGDPRGTGLYVVAELVPLAIAGPVLHHAWLAANLFPAIVTGQAQGIAMTGHHAIDIAETAYRIAVAVDHFVELAMVVVAVLHQGFNGLVVDHASDVGQATQRVVVMQVHPHATGGADVGKRALGGAGEMQEVAQCIFDALQRHGDVVVRHFTEIEEGVVEGLQQIVAAFGADQMHLLMGVVDALPRLHVDEWNTATLIVGEINEGAAAPQALLPRQDPTLAEYAVDAQVAGIKARPLNRHQAREAEVGFVSDDFAPGRCVDRVADQATHRTLDGRPHDVTRSHFTGNKTGGEFQDTRHDSFHAGLGSGLDQLGDTARCTGDRHQNVDRGPQPTGNFVVHRQVAIGSATDEDIVRTARERCAAGQLVTLAGGCSAVDEDVGRTLGDLHRAGMLVAGAGTLLHVGRLAAIDEDIGRRGDDGPRG
ncbi:hypothetical protein PS712_05440 [Pseudomonas fluorescens]|uniref:Uncharacterized protein n=1 Tax=Pseudomonas fluorescens TaxID=294 RepID=A0A5E7FAG4_PSEFL|nr:hypothetical protein PS712_05440 [Pseudomonas fluorescens]